MDPPVVVVREPDHDETVAEQEALTVHLVGETEPALEVPDGRRVGEGAPGVARGQDPPTVVDEPQADHQCCFREDAQTCAGGRRRPAGSAAGDQRVGSRVGRSHAASIVPRAAG